MHDFAITILRNYAALALGFSIGVITMALMNMGRPDDPNGT